MKCLLFSLQQLLHLFGVLQSKMTVFCSKMAAAARGKTKLLGLYGIDSDEEATALFSVHFALCPLSFSAECQVSLGLKVFLLMFDFHVDVLSKLCLWLSVFVFDRSTQRVGFSKNHGHSHWLSFWKEKEESVVSMEREREREREREKKKQLPPSSFTSPLVEVCVYVCV